MAPEAKDAQSRERSRSRSRTPADDGQEPSRGGPVKNSAFVFIKPHAVTERVQEMVRERLASAGISVKRSLQIPAKTIDEEGLIDKHYGAIASRAMSKQPSELAVQEHAKSEFLRCFGLSWEEALAKGLVFNAKGAAAKLGLELAEIGSRCDQLKRGETEIKFGGGFYVGKVDGIYVVNGFYTRMRAQFTEPGACIQCFEVEWDPEELPWKKFRAEIIGTTNPQEAAEGSIRRTIFDKWEALGLKSQPSTGANGVHGSASPFEGLIERANWLGAEAPRDPFGFALIGAGIGEPVLGDWSADPAVTFEGKKHSLFDLLEDLDAMPCISKAREVMAAGA
uniref:Nucleoside-diphosphate kinase n=1 Tax=Alexandrium andersonii TaxID=327968 RepID=A0A7S2NC75_9DINO|mmetsp:Transcript_9131/g.20701  ORF Transcript_9131/g.20701 Transcript_9131/m.20701 type:complete len:337 (+) Transcript_9131:93-1103(+)